MPCPYSAVLFDFDGTFADTGEGVLASANAAFAAMGRPQMPPEAWRPCLGPPLLWSFTCVAGMTPEEAERAIEIYRKAYAEGNCYRLRVYDGMEALLRRLNEAGVPAAVASSKPTVFLEKILEHLGCRGYFAAVVGAELSRQEARKADLLLRAARACGAEPARCLMVGDRKFDMEAARELGMRAVGVLYGFGSEAELRESGADVLAADCGELGEILFPAAPLAGSRSFNP